MSQRTEERKGRVRLPERARRDVAALRASFLQIAEEEVSEIDPAERSKVKSLLIDYLNLILKEQRDATDYYDDEDNENERAAQDELFEQKCELMERVLAKKMEQCRATPASSMAIELDISKPESLFVMRNGVEVPIESELNFAPLEENPQKVQQLHEQQNHFCALYRELLAHQKWLGDKKI